MNYNNALDRYMKWLILVHILSITFVIFFCNMLFFRLICYLLRSHAISCFSQNYMIFNNNSTQSSITLVLGVQSVSIKPNRTNRDIRFAAPNFRREVNRSVRLFWDFGIRVIRFSNRLPIGLFGLGEQDIKTKNPNPIHFINTI